MKSRIVRRLAVAALVAGCVDSAGPEFPALVAHGAALTAAEDPTQLAGIGYEITVENTTSATIHVARCGDVPAVQVERYSGGIWTNQGGDDCAPPSGTGPLAIAPGATMQATRGIAVAGTYRFTLMVASDAAFSDAAQSRTAPIDIE